MLSAADAELAQRLTGADEVLSTEAMDARWPIGEGPPAAIYVESAPAEGYAESRYELQARDAAVANDSWDARLPRERRFAELLRARSRARRSATHADPGRAPERQEPARDRARAARLAARGARRDGGRCAAPSRASTSTSSSRVPLRVPAERRAARRLPLDHRLGHRQHLERALLPEHAGSSRTATSC